MEELRFRHGFREFEIVDDCFNLDRERMRAILTGIRDRLGDVKLHFPNGLRADVLEPDDMMLFKQAGTVSATFAIETASPRLQKMIHKNMNIEKAARMIDASIQAKIYTTGFFMMGFPTETYEEASGTVNFALRSALHRAVFSHAIPFEGTELAEMAADKLKKDGNVIEQRQMSYVTSTLNISAMSDHEMRTIFHDAYRRFYLSPKRILRQIMRHPAVLSLPYYAGILFIEVLMKKRR